MLPTITTIDIINGHKVYLSALSKYFFYVLKSAEVRLETSDEAERAE